jgi:uncharacterized membrane protein
MNTITQLSRKAYGLCIIAFGIQQLSYSRISDDFMPDIFPNNTGYHLLSYTWGILFTLSGAAILFDWKARKVALISGGVFLLLCLLAFLPDYLLFSPQGHSLIEWSPVVQVLSFAGASFIVAGSYPGIAGDPAIIRRLERLVPFGGLFFSIMLITYGADHFVYTKGVATMVPSWIPGPVFWTYFVGFVLIGAGIAITLRIQLRLVGSLMAIMFFLWLIILHIERAVDDPAGNGGLELTRVFVIFGWIGISLLLARSGRRDGQALRIQPA